MALKIAEYIMPDKSVVNDAYVRVKNITTENNDYEKLEPIEGTNDLLETWHTRMETRANVFVYADEGCRRNQVSPIHWYSVEFDYDPESLNNIYQQAYLAVSKKFAQFEEC